MEGPPIGQNRYARDQAPGHSPAGGASQSEHTPEKQQSGRGDTHSLGDREAEQGSERTQRYVEEDVLPLAGNPQPGRMPPLDQLSQPGVVQMASEVSGFDVTMPETRRDQDE